MQQQHSVSESKRTNLAESEDEQQQYLIATQRNNSSTANYQATQQAGQLSKLELASSQANSNSQMFTLQHKPELKRNLGKYNTLDFSNNFDSTGKPRIA